VLLFELYGKPQKIFLFFKLLRTASPPSLPPTKKWLEARQEPNDFIFLFQNGRRWWCKFHVFSSLFFFFHGGFLIRVPSHDHDARARGERETRAKEEKDR
jgi:hypothetical protein